MKFNTKLLVASLCVMGNVYAATTGELKVTGKVTVPSCNIDLSSNGVVDFGSITRDKLNATSSTGLGSKTLKATVLCDGLTAVAIKIVDNVTINRPVEAMNFKFERLGTLGAASLAPGSVFSMQNSNKSLKPYAAYAVRIADVTYSVDAGAAPVKAPNILYSVSGVAGSWKAVTGGYISPDTPFVMAATAGSTYVLGRQFDYPMDVALSIDKSVNVPGIEDITLSGSATLEVMYL